MGIRFLGLSLCWTEDVQICGSNKVNIRNYTTLTCSMQSTHQMCTCTSVVLGCTIHVYTDISKLTVFISPLFMHTDSIIRT